MSAFRLREFETLDYTTGGIPLTLISSRRVGFAGDPVSRGAPADRDAQMHRETPTGLDVRTNRGADLKLRLLLGVSGLDHDLRWLGHHGLGGRIAAREAGGGLDARDAFIKRAFDMVVAALGLLVMSIPMLLIAGLIRLTTKGPALFQQERIGLRGRRFVMLKFRTMRHAVEHPGSFRQATRDDPRVTRIGAWLRRTSFDELPQLLNVLGGTMSLVGPRPHAPGTCAAGRPFETVTHRYDARHAAKPGMTGLAQVRGWRGETDTEEKLLRRIDSDLEYIATWSPGGDVAILWRTIRMMARLPNAY